jgi:hypothetical protein
LSSTLRIRDKEATIKRLEFPKDTIDKLEQLVSANVAQDVKKFGIKKLTGVILAAYVVEFLFIKYYTMLKMLLGLSVIIRIILSHYTLENKYYNIISVSV